ncbi:TIGR02391 family protein [Mycobacterium sp. CBMA271]|uniref:TIGR02391 family protein n=1 Tax=unclassified Mycobacteroides TaxID=2618759 RepID=UPI0012DFE8B5|nr:MULTISPECIES: TIGR02391 family protein [unclassified Mycobacteroides]MUM17774.1 hypothetical protein [Mycobacteroides sp. CBMA 326]MUM22952.1 TIGR02391 family protein [Mycobacteroides sp. CBMA 271]
MADAKKNPEYLRGLAKAVQDFKDAFLELMEFYIPDQIGPKGITPAMWLADEVDEDELKSRMARVAYAAGRAVQVAPITNINFAVQGIGVVDPITNWETVIQPKSFLTPENVTNACDSALGRLEAQIAKAEAEAPPEVGVARMHPLVWGAARILWKDGHYRDAVRSAADAVAQHVRSITGRHDVQETSVWQQAFSNDPPKPNMPRLRWPGDPAHQSVRSMNDGLRQFAPGVQMTIRNMASHGAGEFTEQQGVERLATLSLLAQWVDTCELHEDPGVREGPDQLSSGSA